MNIIYKPIAKANDYVMTTKHWLIAKMKLAISMSNMAKLRRKKNEKLSTD